MWELVLVILINGGSSPTKFETSWYKTQEQCLAAARKRENNSVYGYCSYHNKKTNPMMNITPNSI